MDPENGEILAMASAPDFDPNEFSRYPAEARRNRVIADAYEPGSTFKIVTGALALEYGLVGLDEMIETGDGTIRIANTTIREADRHRYGALTLGGHLRALLQHRHHPRGPAPGRAAGCSRAPARSASDARPEWIFRARTRASSGR